MFPELHVARTDLETMKKQAESTNAEYDRLAEEHQQLQVHTPRFGYNYNCMYNNIIHSFFRILCVNNKEVLKTRKTSKISNFDFLGFLDTCIHA